MNTYRQPMKNIGIVKSKKRIKNERYMTPCDIFDLILSSFIVGVIIGVITTVICLINR